MTAKRTDANHAEIRDGLRYAGYYVCDTHEMGGGFPDLLAVCRTGQIVLLEVKTPSGKLNDNEKIFHGEFPGPARIVRSVEDAISLMQTFDLFGDDGSNPPGVAVAVDETDGTMSDELKPCPFCGGEAIVRRNYSAGGMGGNGYYVECPKCDMSGPFDLGLSGAVAAWNTRPVEDAANARIAELEAELIVSDRLKDRLCALVGAPGDPMEAINLLVYRSGVCEWIETRTACGVKFDGEDVIAEFCSNCGRKIQVNGSSSEDGEG